MDVNYFINNDNNITLFYETCFLKVRIQEWTVNIYTTKEVEKTIMSLK
jgi:hypothetical protein